MSSENEHLPAPVEPTQPAESKLFGVPVSVFVKTGTTSSAHDEQVDAIEADAERRRNESAQERKIASVPIEQGGGRIFNSRLSTSDAQAGYILLQYLTPNGDIRYENGTELQCLADIHLMGQDELCLTIVCPTCVSGGHGRKRLPQGQSQIRIRQSNKKFDLDTSRAGELIVFEEKPYRSAGIIRESERFACPNCNWAARIVNNKVRPE